MHLCKCGGEILEIVVDGVSYQTSCDSCGKRLAIDPLVTNYYAKEPPVTTWKNELERDGRKYTEESMREVREEAIRRSKANMPVKVKRQRLRFIKNEFLAFLSLIWGLVLAVWSLLLVAAVVVALYVFYSGGLAFLPERAYNYVVAEFEEEPTRILPVVSGGSGSDYKFLNLDQSGNTLTWDPCMPISYVMNPDGMPANGKELIQSAVDEVSASTGLQFVYAGESNELYTDPHQPYQPSTYPSFGKNWSPVLISWLSESDFQKELEALKYSEDTAGFAGPEIASTDNYSNRSELLGSPYYVSGTVTLSSRWFNSDQALRYPDDARAIIMHEFGHLVGLDHVDSQAELMASDNYGKTSFGDGDLAGLARLGSGSCAKPHQRPQVREINYQVN